MADGTASAAPLLEVKNLAVRFGPAAGGVNAVRRVDLTVGRKEVLGIIGESGSGKSVTGLSILRLLPGNATITADTLKFGGRDLLTLSDRQFRELRGTHLAMIFQDPVGAFNPAKSIRWHLDRVLKRAAESERRATSELTQSAHRWLRDVGIGQPERVLSLYPHQLSGGMLQRTLIALIAALQPDLLIADEPTTNLDNIVERQIVSLFRRVKSALSAAIIFITHDISLAAGLCDRIAVMYAGEVVETGPAQLIFERPAHPYTQSLIAMSRELDRRGERLSEIPGELPSALAQARGCLFAQRCPRASDVCRERSPEPAEPAPGHTVRCFHHDG